MSITKNRRYGQWAGNPEGNKEDGDRCREEVWPASGWRIPYQCLRRRGYGPNAEFCAQHAKLLAIRMGRTK